jgi:hypothetical protein
MDPFQGRLPGRPYSALPTGASIAYWSLRRAWLPCRVCHLGRKGVK